MDTNKTEKFKTIKPPFGYYGSKHRLASKIIRKLPPHNTWVEAFCGSAAVTLAKSPAPIEVINDLDGEIINLFQQLRDYQEELCRLIALTPYAREEYNKAKECPNRKSRLERARQFLVATMMTVNGANGGQSSGFSFSQSYSRGGNEARVNRWYNLPERLEIIVERLRKTRIENRDAQELLTMFENKPATLIYLDPPYNIDRKQRYNVDIDSDFHIALLNKCVESRAMIMISGYENALYNATLTPQNGWTKKCLSTTTKDTKGKDHARTEVLWTNQLFETTLKSNQIQVEFTREEIRENKVNPDR